MLAPKSKARDKVKILLLSACHQGNRDKNPHTIKLAKVAEKSTSAFAFGEVEETSATAESKGVHYLKLSE